MKINKGQTKGRDMILGIKVKEHKITLTLLHINTKKSVMKKLSSILLLTLALAFFSACEENVPVPPIAETEAPDLPVAEMYTMPFDEVTETETDTVNNQTQGVTYRNWAFAGINLLVWNTAVVINVSVPLAAVGAAFNEQPVYQGNGVWEWSYVYTAPPALGGKTYDVVLTGEYILGATEVEWTMTTSQRGGFSNFEWITAVTKVDGSEADFTINHRPNNPQSYLMIEYDKDLGSVLHQIRYTNVNPSSNTTGGYVEYRATSNSPFNREFEVGAGPINPTNILEIQWNEPNGNGRVRNEQHYNDTDWHCWDTLLRDTNC